MHFKMCLVSCPDLHNFWAMRAFEYRQIARFRRARFLVKQQGRSGQIRPIAHFTCEWVLVPLQMYLKGLGGVAALAAQLTLEILRFRLPLGLVRDLVVGVAVRFQMALQMGLVFEGPVAIDTFQAPRISIFTSAPFQVDGIEIRWLVHVAALEALLLDSVVVRVLGVCSILQPFAQE